MSPDLPCSSRPGEPDAQTVSGSDRALAALITRLGARRDPRERYQVGEELAHGGMGRILRVRDQDLHRDLAMKVLSADGEGGSPRSPTVSRQVARFLEEAQVTGQLDHPGIVPVHELGLDREGRLFFTMKLVRGRTLREVIDLQREGRDGWSQTRVLGVLLKVCEAMSYAHARGVIHRDLKPANVMVGGFGEVYVMDWGLAHLLDREDVKDIRVREPAPRPGESPDELYSERHELSAGPDSPMVTMDGDVVGTPAYMPPEQADGRVHDVGPRSDVYAVGAMLYHLLAGRMPYSIGEEQPYNHAVWYWVRRGPPAPVARLAPEAAPELVAICEKAMARDLAQRYATMEALAEDLRAFLENRVVQAHRSGPWIELRKWVVRNRGIAAALATLVLVVTAAGFAVAWKERERLAEASFGALEHDASRVLGRADEPLPIHPDQAAAMEALLGDIRAVLARGEPYELERSSLLLAAQEARRVREVDAPPDPVLMHEIVSRRSLAQQFEDLLGPGFPELTDPEEASVLLPRQIERLRKEAARLEAERRAPRYVFDRPEEQTRYDRLSGLAEALAGLRERAPEIEDRLLQARTLRTRSIEDEAGAWASAIASLAEHDGVTLRPQMGLVPLGRDPHSNLWEFWHVLSGRRPSGEPGSWVVGDDTGLVLVLIPGGRVVIGAQKDDPAAPNFDPDAQVTEKPQEIVLAPYFISKYELTQGQWQRARGECPSQFGPGMKLRGGPRVSLANPVENVSWTASERALRAWGLALPSEAQWEHAARGGARTPYAAGATFEEVALHVNSADQCFEEQSVGRRGATQRDGHAVHARVGSFPPNGFGLHEVNGNVAEWCLDWYADSCDRAAVRGGTGERVPGYSDRKVVRGGSYANQWFELRNARRWPVSPSQHDEYIGLRPVRLVDP
jgi:serine/threonine protein kinase/formylglycine-generating enzyme required for sulfatase activity